MKSITVHKLDAELYAQLQKEAKSEGLSLNKLVKKILRRSLGLDPIPRKKIDFSDFVGSWSEEELASFEKLTMDFDQIELNEW